MEPLITVQLNIMIYVEANEVKDFVANSWKRNEVTDLLIVPRFIE